MAGWGRFTQRVRQDAWPGFHLAEYLHRIEFLGCQLDAAWPQQTTDRDQLLRGS